MSEETLRTSLDEAEWAWLKPHFERDAVILVDQTLSVLQVAVALEKDSSSEVQQWIQRGLLKKPTLEQAQEWERNSSARFLSVVVQPYVLIQIR